MEDPGSFSGMMSSPARCGAARQPAHVVGDLHEGGRQRLEGAVGMDLGIARRQDLELVGALTSGRPVCSARVLATASAKPGGS